MRQSRDIGAGSEAKGQCGPVEVEGSFRQLGLKGQRQRCREGDGAYQEPQGDPPGGRERMLEGLV